MKQAILTLILNNPNIRTVEIADRIDLDPDQVRPLIAGEIASGAIVEEEVRAPNGRLVMSFRYASTKPVPRAFDVAVVAEHVPARIARTVKPGGSLSDIFPHLVPASEIDVPVTRKADVPPAAVELAPAVIAVRDPEPAPGEAVVTKVALGVAYLLAQDAPVSSMFLALAMDLKKGHHPSSYMRVAIKNGWVTYSAATKLWSKGAVPCPVAPSAPVAVAATVEHAPLVVPKFIAGERGASAELAAASTAAPERQVADQVAAADVEQAASNVIHSGAGLCNSSESEFRAVIRDWPPTEPSETPQLRAPAECGAERFLAGVLSDGSLHLRVPGKAPFDLPPEHARDLYQFMQAHAYIAWPKQQAA